MHRSKVDLDDLWLPGRPLDFRSLRTLATQWLLVSRQLTGPAPQPPGFVGDAVDQAEQKIYLLGALTFSRQAQAMVISADSYAQPETRSRGLVVDMAP